MITAHLTVGLLLACGLATADTFVIRSASFQLLADPGARRSLWVQLREKRGSPQRKQTYLRSLAGEKQIASGSLVSIYGRDLAAQTLFADSMPLPIRLGGVSVSFDGRPAPLLFVSPDEIKAQAPFGLAPKQRVIQQQPA